MRAVRLCSLCSLAARFALAVSISAVTAAPPVSAASSAEMLDEVQVTATALPTTAAAATQHVSVLRREDLDALRGQSLAEVLSRQAGLVIDRGGRSGGYGALYLRGADPSHVVVLIDHVRQNDPLSSRGSAVDLNTLTLDDIERIEIVRGNASVAHAEAMAGLIHLFTRRATAGASAGVAAGGDGLRGAHARIGGGGWRIGASDREDGDDAGGLQQTRAANLGWEHAQAQRWSLRATARFADSDQRGFPDDSGGARFAELRELQLRHDQTRQQSLRGEYRLAAGTFELQAARFSRDSEDASPGVAPGLRDPFGLPALSADSDYRRDESQASWQGELGSAWQLGLGAQHQHERGRSAGRIDFGAFVLPTAFALSRRSDSVFAELRWANAGWTLQGGLRHERWRDDGEHRSGSEHSSTGRDSATHPMLSLQHLLPGERGHWGASLAQSSKAPSFYALGHPLVGNPALRSERARHRELYYASAADAVWPSRLTLFSARYRDLIDFDSGPPPQLVNRERIEADGLEWRSERRLPQDWRLQLDGSWMRVRNPADGSALRYRPRLQAGAGLRIPLRAERELILGLRHLGRRFDSSIPTGDRWLDASTLVDVGLRQQLGAFELLLAVDNLANAREEEAIGVLMPGRRLRLSLQWQTP
ncbi:TonB-dependent receptor plug domain-containing protein [Aquimonas sp.]|jgi:vitamin B12 transporter|uniref:TonB-dependent receptor plug domain-containing protein n=1 Tax=Aquimonas sp. TaxID=1872588 RepID=UPI0037BE9058